MATFASHQSYWHFCESVLRRWRHGRDEEQDAFLGAVLESSQDKVDVIRAGSLVWRAQLGCDWPETDEEEALDPGPRAFGIERMKPWRDKAMEGRVNPRGIPCLYTATHRDTAVAEVGPWAERHVSVGQFTIHRDLRVVNCTSDDHSHRIFFKEPSPEEREKEVWRDIDRAFSRPVTRSEHIAEYAPTQVLAEMFRRNGFDAIAYRSSLGPGHNIAIFDLEAADLINCTVAYVRRLAFEIDDAANPYFVTKYYPEVAKPDGQRRPKRHHSNRRSKPPTPVAETGRRGRARRREGS
jgi:hypothetical protein